MKERGRHPAACRLHEGVCALPVHSGRGDRPRLIGGWYPAAPILEDLKGGIGKQAGENKLHRKGIIRGEL